MVESVNKELIKIHDILPEIQKDTQLQSQPIYSAQLKQLDSNLERIKDDLSIRIGETKGKISDPSFYEAVKSAEELQSSIQVYRGVIDSIAQSVNNKLEAERSTVESLPTNPHKPSTGGFRR